MFKETNSGYIVCVADEDGKIHNEGHPAYVAVMNPKSMFYSIYWYTHGILNRADGPAVETKFIKRWVVNGKNHRVDGPAIIRDVGDDEYWVNNKQYSREEYEKLFAGVSPEQKQDLAGMMDVFD